MEAVLGLGNQGTIETVMRDPFYAKIVEALSGRLDSDLFEQCACDLLREEHPTLAPIPGGSDFGMDGETAGDGPFLVATTSERVIRNLTNSLESVIRSGDPRGQIILATSQKLSATRRKNLRNKASEKGFALVQIYGRSAIADRLYGNPRWYQELLGLTGRPSALSEIPSGRPLGDQPIVGREEALEWLLDERREDCLVIGVPGSGKTFLLNRLVESRKGLFLRDNDRTAAANAIRELKPKAIIVDDAHFRSEDLEMLRQLRAEVKASYGIVASCWPGERLRIQQCLSLDSSQTLELETLSDQEIVDVLKGIRINRPLDLVHELVSQSRGRPGLAVTLGRLCQNGRWREVVQGEAVQRDLLPVFERLVGKDATQFLAVLALGGDSGMSLEKTARGLELSLSRAHQILTGLSAGGVIEEVVGDCISVWPVVLRFVLVRDTFFCGPGKLPLQRFSDQVPSIPEFARTLMGAKSRGARIHWLRKLVEQAAAADRSVWRDYASLGEEEAVWVLNNKRNLFDEVARTILRSAPAQILPLLIQKAAGDTRELHNTSSHPLRLVQDWIKGAHYGFSQTVRNRKLLLDAVIPHIAGGGDLAVAARAVGIALEPDYQKVGVDPGSGGIVVYSSGLYSLPELEEMAQIWRPAWNALRSIPSDHWRPVLQAVRSWARPVFTGMGKAHPDALAFARSTASSMLLDLRKRLRTRPGAQQWIGKELENLGVDSDVLLDEEFEIIYPPYPRLEMVGKDHVEAERNQVQKVHQLARFWRTADPDAVAEKLLNFEKDIELIQKNWPRHSPALCEELARLVDQPGIWFQAVIQRNLDCRLAEPFLLRLANEPEQRQWQEAVAQCFESQAYRGLAVWSVAQHPDPPAELVKKMCDAAADYTGVIQSACTRKKPPSATLVKLLNHGDRAVATAAAVGVFDAARVRKIPEEIFSDWSSAMERARGEQESIAEILEAYPRLAYPWLKGWQGESHYVARTDKIVQTATSLLDREERLKLLHSMQGSYRQDFVERVVGDDVALYREVLRQEEMREWHLVPLHHLSEAWREKALAAIEAGYQPAQIAEASYWIDDVPSGWTGDAMPHQEDSFARELAQEEGPLREIGREALKLLVD